jgi:hypothetical protein
MVKEITVQNLLEFQSGYVRIVESAISIKAAYKLNKIYEQMQKEQPFIRNAFSKIIDKYSEKDESGNPVINHFDNDSEIAIKKEYEDKCAQEIQELYDLKIKIDNFDLSIDDFGDSKITINILKKLELLM